jgi:hypothetical protein
MDLFTATALIVLIQSTNDFLQTECEIDLISAALYQSQSGLVLLKYLPESSHGPNFAAEW